MDGWEPLLYQTTKAIADGSRSEFQGTAHILAVICMISCLFEVQIADGLYPIKA